MPKAIAVLAVLLAAASCGPSGDPRIQVDSAWARPTLQAGQTGAAYLTIRNRGPGNDRLVAVTSDVSSSANLHSSSNEGGIARMRPVKGGLLIPANRNVALQPGGFHVMLERVSKPLKPGEHIRLTLRFEKSGDRVAHAMVGNRAPGEEHQGH